MKNFLLNAGIKMNNVVKITFQNRTLNLYGERKDITRKGNIKIMKHSDKGFFYIEHKKMFDVEGQFDIFFDQGEWNKKFLSQSVEA